MILKANVLAISLAAFSMVASAATVVVPNANTATAGNDSSGALPTAAISGEFQDVINPSQFPAGTLSITGFAWRAAPGLGALSVSATGTISLSTSTTFANSVPGPILSNTFANNVGGDVAQVFSGTITVTGAACAGPAPCPFANTTTFATPFAYNPANGPLLMDFKLTSFGGPGTTGQFDVQDCAAATCTDNGNSGGPLGVTTGALNNSDNVTLLTYSLISATPVPPSILITLLGLACVGFYFGRRGLKTA